VAIKIEAYTHDRRHKRDAAAKQETSEAEPHKPEKNGSPLDYLPTSDSIQPDVDTSDVVY
jgi:hypothetical protein